MANVTRLGPVMYRRKCCDYHKYDCSTATSGYYETKGFMNLSYTENTDYSTNKKTYTINRIWFSTESVDNGYFNSCGGEERKCDYGCCEATTIYWNNNGTWAKLCTVDFSHSYPGTDSSYASVGTNMVVTLYPGQSFTLTVGKGEASCTRSYTATHTFTNTLSEPVREYPPTASLSCSASTTNPHSVTVNTSGTWGSCANGVTYNSTFGLYTSSSYTASSRVTSQAGTFNAAQSNTTYYARYTRNNGCSSTATATCSVTTIPENRLANLAVTGPNSATMQLTVMGGPAYAITTQVQRRKCSEGAWTTIKTYTTAKGSNQQIYNIELDDLEDDTCYQFQAISTTTAGRYVSEALTTQTPQLGAFGFFDSIDSEVTSNNDISTTFCYNWQAKNLPAQLTVFYRVKDGYDPSWSATDTITLTTAIGNRCVTVTGLFPNQVEYEAYIHTYIPQYDVEWDGEITTFVTPLLPVPEFYQCETLGYMAELLCSSVKRLYSGNKTIYANPASREECDPYSEEPTFLTLWSRALRFFTATKCLAEGMMGTLLMQSKPGQYLVGEYGWADPIKTLDEWKDENNLWRIPSSAGAFAYLNEKMHSVWHYHSAVDYLEQTLDELKAAPGATSGIVMDDNKVYTKAGNNRWVASTTDVPDDFAVYHINKTSQYAEAGQAWFYWGGTWKNLDSDITAAMKLVQEIEEQSDVIVDNEAGAADATFTVVPETYDFDQLPQDGNRYICLLTENEDKQPVPEMRVMFVGWTPELSADNTPISVLNPECEVSGSTSNVCGSNDWIVPVSYYSSRTNPDCQPEQTIGAGGLQCKALIQPVPQGNPATKPVPPVYPGHKFLGWRLGVFTNGEWEIEDSFYDFDTPIMVDFIDQNMALFAQWARNVITVGVTRTPGVEGPYPSERVEIPALATVGEWPTYNAVLDPSQYTSTEGEVVGWELIWGQKLPCAAILENSGYSVRPSLQRPMMIVTFVLNNSLPDVVQEVKYSSRITDAPIPTKIDEVFDHWSLYDNPNAPAFDLDTQIVQNTTLYAFYHPANVTVNFDSNGGSPVESQIIPYGTGPTQPTDPTKEGYVLEYWVTPQGWVYNEWGNAGYITTSPYTLTAVWKVAPHTVTFDSNGGSPVASQAVEDGNYASQPANPTKPPCTFDGWYAEGHIVTFDSDGGTTIDSQEVLDGQQATQPINPTKPPCTFDGWYYDDEEE